jgi:hypothetical protein
VYSINSVNTIQKLFVKEISVPKQAEKIMHVGFWWESQKER